MFLQPSDRGVRDHAASAHDLGQVSARHHRWRLVVDAALEARGAPVHELNGALGLDGGHGGVHVLGHHIALVLRVARRVRERMGTCVGNEAQNLVVNIGYRL